MIELILCGFSVAASGAAYGVGRIHGREAAQQAASRFADWKIQAYGAETTYEQTKREAEEKVAADALAQAHGHPGRFCSPATNCYGMRR